VRLWIFGGWIEGVSPLNPLARLGMAQKANRRQVVENVAGIHPCQYHQFHQFCRLAFRREPLSFKN